MFVHQPRLESAEQNARGNSPRQPSDQQHVEVAEVLRHAAGAVQHRIQQTVRLPTTLIIKYGRTDGMDRHKLIICLDPPKKNLKTKNVVTTFYILRTSEIIRKTNSIHSHIY